MVSVYTPPQTGYTVKASGSLAAPHNGRPGISFVSYPYFLWRVGGLARIEETWMPENSFLQEFLAYAQDWRYNVLSPPSYLLLQGSRPVQMIHWIIIAFNNCRLFAQDECR